MCQMGTAGRGGPGRGVGAAGVPTLVGWAVGIVVTAAILGTPYLLFAYHSPDLHLVLDSLDTGVALLVAYLLFGRYSRTGRLQDLLLAAGLLLLGLAGIGLTLVLRLLGLDDDRGGVWLPVAMRVIGAVLVLAASMTSARRPAGRWSRPLKLLPWVAVAVGVAVTWALGDSLPLALAQTPPASAQRPVIAGHAGLLAAHAVTALCFAVASVAFAVTSRPRAGGHDELIRWLGPAFALAAFARLNYLLFPSLYSDWLYTGDLLRTASYAVLLVGAAREIRRYWSMQAQAAVIEDRRRLARELHDGVVQELGYIRVETQTLTGDTKTRERILAVRPGARRGPGRRRRTGTQQRRTARLRPPPSRTPGRGPLQREPRGRAGRLGARRRRPAACSDPHHPRGRVQRHPSRPCGPRAAAT